MTDETISVHDAFQLEIKQHLPFSADGSASRYASETFIFTPSSLNINSETFPKAHFYRSLKNYIRLHVPVVPLPDILAPNGRLARLAEDTEALAESLLADEGSACAADEEALSRHREETKLFCLFLQRSVRQERLRILSLPPGDFTSACGGFVQITRRISEQVFSLVPAGEMPVHIQAAQEFCSTVISYNALRLLRHAREDKPEAEALRRLIKDMRASRKGFGPGTEPESEGDNVPFVSRWNTLKKYVNTPLFLEIRHRREGVFIQHLAYSIAAALAMIFATAIAFIWQIHYGAVSFPLFVALVVSYIFKDRLKDILREYMMSALARRVFDRRMYIFRNQTNLGTCRELVTFLQEKHVPSDVRAVRDLTAGELPYAMRLEEILYYHKRIVVTPGLENTLDTGALVDITRLSLWELSRNMDGDTEHLLVLSGDRVRDAVGTKTYPIYIVRRHNHEGVRECTAYRVLMSSAGVREVRRLYPQNG